MRRMIVALLIFAVAASAVVAKGSREKQVDEFITGIKIELDGQEYFFDGPPIGPNQELDVPGHEWKLTGANTLVGRHWNRGPDGKGGWWSSDAGSEALLYEVEAVIDTWAPEKALDYADRGFVHYHDLVRVGDGFPHPTKVAWLKHTAVSEFTLDGGPRPGMGHTVVEGVDTAFMNNFHSPTELGVEYQKGLSVELDSGKYFLAGPPVGPNGEPDVPGHDWILAGDNRMIGRHFNTGPDGSSSWWSSDATDGSLLFIVEGIIDSWTEQKAKTYFDRGYVHYHELVEAESKEVSADKVLWLRHRAVEEFQFDRGPNPDLAHETMVGVDLDFMPNASKPHTTGS